MAELTKREYVSTAILQALVGTLTIDRQRHKRLMCNTAIQYADMLLAFLDDQGHDEYDDEGEEDSK